MEDDEIWHLSFFLLNFLKFETDDNEIRVIIIPISIIKIDVLGKKNTTKYIDLKYRKESKQQPRLNTGVLELNFQSSSPSPASQFKVTWIFEMGKLSKIFCK